MDVVMWDRLKNICKVCEDEAERSLDRILLKRTQKGNKFVLFEVGGEDYSGPPASRVCEIDSSRIESDGVSGINSMYLDNCFYGDKFVSMQYLRLKLKGRELIAKAGDWKCIPYESLFSKDYKIEDRLYISPRNVQRLENLRQVLSDRGVYAMCIYEESGKLITRIWDSGGNVIIEKRKKNAFIEWGYRELVILADNEYGISIDGVLLFTQSMDNCSHYKRTNGSNVVVIW